MLKSDSKQKTFELKMSHSRQWKSSQNYQKSKLKMCFIQVEPWKVTAQNELEGTASFHITLTNLFSVLREEH